MSLDDLQDDVEAAYTTLGNDLDVNLDRGTRNELALLASAFDPEETDELVRRAIHLLFQTAVETGNLDFHLRSTYDITYDEYLMGVTMDTYNEQQGYPQPDTNDDRRYQF